MKIDRFNVPDFNSFQDVKNVKSNEGAARTDFSSRLEGASPVNQSAATSPLQSELTKIAKASNLNNPTSINGAVDQAARAIVDSLVSPELKGKINMEAMKSVMAEFAQNDPVIGQRLQRLLMRLA